MPDGVERANDRPHTHAEMGLGEVNPHGKGVTGKKEVRGTATGKLRGEHWSEVSDVPKAC